MPPLSVGSLSEAAFVTPQQLFCFRSSGGREGAWRRDVTSSAAPRQRIVVRRRVYVSRPDGTLLLYRPLFLSLFIDVAVVDMGFVCGNIHPANSRVDKSPPAFDPGNLHRTRESDFHDVLSPRRHEQCQRFPRP